MFKIHFDLPNLPEGAEIQITGIPFIFHNGGTYEVSDESEKLFRFQNPVVSGTNEAGFADYEPGPSLEDAFKENEHIHVEKSEGGSE